MPTKQLDRLMFAQGDLCFFCKQPLPKAEASVEHLFAKANGGDNHDENCVTCCKALNALLGSMSLKEKFQVVLNQKGHFKCPNGVGTAKTSAIKSNNDNFKQVVTNLKQRGHSKPRTLKTLTSTIASLGLTEAEAVAMIQQLQSKGQIVVTENKVSYTL